MRSLMPMLPSQASLHNAGKVLCPPVSEVQVENALDVLLLLGFLRRENGGYRQGQAHIHVPEDLRRKAVRDFQARMMERGVELLRSEGDGHRRFTTATMGFQQPRPIWWGCAQTDDAAGITTTESGQIAGRVVDAQGDGEVDVLVVLRRVENMRPEVGRDTTDALGAYLFDSLAAGTYVLGISHGGVESEKTVEQAANESLALDDGVLDACSAATSSADGHLWAWGGSDYGQLGIGTTTGALVPTQLGNSKWIDIHANSNAAVGVLASGVLYAWGAFNNANEPVAIGSSAVLHA